MPDFSGKDLDRIFSSGRIISGLDPKTRRLDDGMDADSWYGFELALDRDD